MAGLKWNTGKLYYSTVERGYQHKYAQYEPAQSTDWRLATMISAY